MFISKWHATATKTVVSSGRAPPAGDLICPTILPGREQDGVRGKIVPNMTPRFTSLLAVGQLVGEPNQISAK